MFVPHDAIIILNKTRVINVFKAKIKLYCPTVNFLETQFMMHAWSMTSFTGQMVKKETHLNSMEWANVMNLKQPSAMYWPEIQQCDIQEFCYCILMVVQPIVDSDIHEFVLKIVEGN